MVFLRTIATTIAACCCAILTACSPLPPAIAPPQLTHTPGEYIEIAKGRFKAGSFQFDYPSSWLLVKQGAGSADAMHIILRAPGGGELSIRVVEAETGQGGSYIPLASGNFLLLTVDASNDAASDLASGVEQIIRSIRS